MGIWSTDNLIWGVGGVIKKIERRASLRKMDSLEQLEGLIK